jgi:hypothetical protein
MKKATSEEQKYSKIFITDKALQNPEYDEFGHIDYASLIERLVLEQPTPFNIGIFGKWGVGKSTIVNLLKEKLKNEIRKNKIKFLEIRVWKYDENTLRRKFIVKIAEGLGLPIDTVYQEIYYDKEYENALINMKDILSLILNKKSFVFWSLVIFFSLWILFRIINIIGFGESIFTIISLKIEQVLVLPLFISIITWAFAIIKEAKIKLKVSKYDSEEQFENKFIELVKNDRSTKIIFIDDLDRCSKEKVVKTIETIKTFLEVESCIFIIACDDEIIKKAINKTHELYNEYGVDEGSEYLEKFFQHTFRIPPFQVTDMRKYVLNLLRKDNNDLLKLGQTLEDIIFITINRNVRSPRNAITAMNEFSSSYILALRREGDSSTRLHNKKITNNLPILAVVTSIKLHFSNFYNDMLKNADLIFWIRNILEGNLNKLNAKQLEICSKYFQSIKREKESIESSHDLDNEKVENPIIEEYDWTQPKNDEIRRLLHFIESIKDYLTIDDISPFLYLGIDATSYLIGDENLQEFNDALKNGIESKIIKIIEEADPQKREHLFDHITSWIEEKLEGVEQRKALQILSKQFYQCPASKIHIAARVFYNKFFKRSIQYEEFKKYSPNGIFICARTLTGSYQIDLITQCVNFLGNNDVDYDKILLHEIFENEDLILNKNLILIITTYLEERSQAGSSPELEKKRIDFNFIKTFVQNYKNKSSIIDKFLSFKLIDEVIEKLFSIDSQEQENEEYIEIVSIFEIIRDIKLKKDISRLCSIYRNLVSTRMYYSQVLEDILSIKNEIPLNEVKLLTVPLLDEIGSINNESSLKHSFDICDFLFGKFPEALDEELKENLANKLIEVSKNENDAVKSLSLQYFTTFSPTFSAEVNNRILSNYTLLINPVGKVDLSNNIKAILILQKEILNQSSRVGIINKLVNDLNTFEGINNEFCYNFWNSLFIALYEVFQIGELDTIILSNSPQFILNVSFANATNTIRARYCNIVVLGFNKVSSSKQNDFFELFRAFLSTNLPENSEFAIKYIYSLIQYFPNTQFSQTSIPLLINQFSIEINPNTLLKNVRILFSVFALLDSTQILNILEVFVIRSHEEPQESLNFLMENWERIPYNTKFKIIKNLLPTTVLSNNTNKDEFLTKIKSDLIQIDENNLPLFISEREHELKNNELERDFYAQIMKHINTYISSTSKLLIKQKKIAEIKIEPDIDLCRNIMSTLINIKEKEYEKDREVNDLFFSLLNDNISKKKLAIDVFEFYYEENHPYQRKGALEERFNNLLDELEEDYKNKLRHLAHKYQLNVKRTFWESLFGN